MTGIKKPRGATYSGLSAGWVASTVSAASALLLAPAIIAALGLTGAASWFLLDIVIASAGILDLGAGRLYVHYLSSGKRYARLAGLERFCALFNRASGASVGVCVGLYYLLGEISWNESLSEKTIAALGICVFGGAYGHLALPRLQAEVTGGLGLHTVKLALTNFLATSGATAIALGTASPSAVVTTHAVIFAGLAYTWFRPRDLLQVPSPDLPARVALTWARLSMPFFLSALPALLMSPLVRVLSVTSLSLADFSLFSFLLRAAGFVNNGFAVLTGQAHAIFRGLDRRAAMMFLASQSSIILAASVAVMLLALAFVSVATAFVPDELNVALQPRVIITVTFYGAVLAILELVLRNTLANKAFLALSMLRVLNLGVVLAASLIAVLFGSLSVTSLMSILASASLVTLAVGVHGLVSSQPPFASWVTRTKNRLRG